jgi:hypothetical protein
VRPRLLRPPALRPRPLALLAFLRLGLLDDARHDHLHDQLVRLLLHGNARRQWQVGDAELVADVHRGHVRLDTGRDVFGLGLDAEREHELLEHAAVTHAFGLADEVNGDLGGDGDVAAHTDEIDEVMFCCFCAGDFNVYSRLLGAAST